MKPEAIQILADSARGIYIPQHFAETIDRDRVTGVSAEAYEILEAGPEHEEYWDAWSEVEQSAVLTDSNGNVYRLHGDGDLFAVCDELMTDQEYEDFYQEPRDRNYAASTD